MSLMSDLGLAIKSKLDTKANINNPVFTGSVTLPSTTQIGTLTSTTIGYLDGITGNIQTQINSKLSSTGTAATATKLATARTINGVAFDGTANITVVDSTKAPLASPAFTGTVTAPTFSGALSGNATSATTATNVAWSGVTSKPTTLVGYGITDAATSSHTHNTVDMLANKPGFMSVDDAIKLGGIAVGANNYTLPVATASVLGGVKAGANVTIDANGVISANDSSVAWSEVTSKPTTLSGYGITDLNSSVQSIRATASQYGTAKMSLSGSTLTISTI